MVCDDTDDTYGNAGGVTGWCGDVGGDDDTGVYCVVS